QPGAPISVVGTGKQLQRPGRVGNDRGDLLGIAAKNQLGNTVVSATTMVVGRGGAGGRHYAVDHAKQFAVFLDAGNGAGDESTHRVGHQDHLLHRLPLRAMMGEHHVLDVVDQ